MDCDFSQNDETKWRKFLVLPLPVTVTTRIMTCWIPNLKFHLPRLHPGRGSSHTPASDHCSYDSQRVSALFETFPSRTQQTHRQHPIFGLYKQIEFQVKSPISYNCFFSCFFFFRFFCFSKMTAQVFVSPGGIFSIF